MEPWNCERCGQVCGYQPLNASVEGIQARPKLCKSCHEIWCDRVTALFSNFMRVGLGS